MVNVEAIVSVGDGSLVAGENLFLTCSVDVPQSLNAVISYVWIGNGEQVGTDSRLDFAPLLVSNSGIYLCRLTVTSVFQTSVLTDESDPLLLTVEGELLPL